MDYQASTRCSKEIIRENSTGSMRCGFVALLVLFLSFGTTFADDPAPNPLTENITISAVVLQRPNTNPDTPPISPPGPVNTTDTFDVAVFKGSAYPGSIISLIKNGILLATIPANPDGTFELHVRNLSPGTYSFGIRAQDSNGLTSKLLTFSIYVSSAVAFIANLADNIKEMSEDDENWSVEDTVSLIKESYKGFYSSQVEKEKGSMGFIK
jgi:hypothetical protein